MHSTSYVVDRVLHWVSALLLLFMLMNLSTQLHNVDWDIKGQLLHRQEAVELHAVIGVVLLVVMLARLIFPSFVKLPLPRIEPKTPAHGLFIKFTHIGLYSCIFLLAVTGIVLINNYEIPLSVWGIELAADKDAFYETFPTFHDIHMILKQSLWWLIAIHFVGIMAAKR